MFNWGYSLIGFAIGWLGGAAKVAEKRGAQNLGFQSILGLALIGFLIFSASFGIEWGIMGVVEVFIGAVVGIKMSK